MILLFLDVMVLEKDWADQLARSCEKGRSITKSQGLKEYPTYSKQTEG